MRNALFGLVILALPMPASAQVTIWWDWYSQGRPMYVSQSVGNLKAYGFNDKMSSLEVERGYAAGFYRHADFVGDYIYCVGPVKIDDLKAPMWDLNDAISSIRISEVRDSEGYCTRHWPSATPSKPERREPNLHDKY